LRRKDDCRFATFNFVNLSFVMQTIINISYSKIIHLEHFKYWIQWSDRLNLEYKYKNRILGNCMTLRSCLYSVFCCGLTNRYNIFVLFTCIVLYIQIVIFCTICYPWHVYFGFSITFPPFIIKCLYQVKQVSGHAYVIDVC
jgi:hypothetical protein